MPAPRRCHMDNGRSRMSRLLCTAEEAFTAAGADQHVLQSEQLLQRAAQPFCGSCGRSSCASLTPLADVALAMRSEALVVGACSRCGRPRRRFYAFHESRGRRHVRVRHRCLLIAMAADTWRHTDVSALSTTQPLRNGDQLPKIISHPLLARFRTMEISLRWRRTRPR